MINKNSEKEESNSPKRVLTFHDDDFKRKIIAAYLDGDVSKNSI